MIPARRHDFIWLDARGLGPGPLQDWAAAGRPFVQRAGLAEPGKVLLGWCQPPDGGPRRHGFSAPADAIRRRARPPRLSEAADAAPDNWRPLIDRLLAEEARRHLELRVYGSLAWSALTGLSYLRPQSDLDLLIGETRGGPGREGLAFLRAFEAHVAPRVDGEIVFSSGDAVAWREILSAPREVLVRGLFGPRLANLDSIAEGRL